MVASRRWPAVCPAPPLGGLACLLSCPLPPPRCRRTRADASYRFFSLRNSSLARCATAYPMRHTRRPPSAGTPLLATRNSTLRVRRPPSRSPAATPPDVNRLPRPGSAAPRPPTPLGAWRAPVARFGGAQLGQPIRLLASPRATVTPTSTDLQATRAAMHGIASVDTLCLLLSLLRLPHSRPAPSSTRMTRLLLLLCGRSHLRAITQLTWLGVSQREHARTRKAGALTAVLLVARAKVALPSHREQMMLMPMATLT